MSQILISGLTMMMGLIAVGIGSLIAAARLRAAQRVYQRATLCSGTVREGWASWFVDGFSTVAMGRRWLSAAAVWLSWTLVGAGLVWLGLRSALHT